MKKWVILAILLKIIWISITVHSDFWGLVIGGYLFAEQGVINVYDYYLSLPKEHELVQSFRDSFFPYPPLALFTFGLWTYLVRPVTDVKFLSGLFYNLSQVFESKEVIWHIFWFKIPYLIFDFGIAWLLWRSFTGIKQRKMAVFLWLFNPVVFYSLAVGNFDLIPTFFVVLSLYYMAKRNNLLLSAFMLGIGAAYKIFPLLFFPLLVIMERRGIVSNMKVGIAAVLPLILTILPFWNSDGFRSMVIFNRTTTYRFFESGFFISDEVVSIFTILALVVVYAIFLKYRLIKYLLRFHLALLLVVFGFINFHLQWFVWIVPLVIVEQVDSKFKYWKLGVLLLLLWLVLVMLASADLNFGLFVPLKTLGMFEQITPEKTAAIAPLTIVRSLFRSSWIDEIIRSVFAVVSLLYVYYLIWPNWIQSKNRHLKRV